MSEFNKILNRINIVGNHATIYERDRIETIDKNCLPFDIDINYKGEVVIEISYRSVSYFVGDKEITERNGDLYFPVNNDIYSPGLFITLSRVLRCNTKKGDRRWVKLTQLLKKLSALH